MAGCMPASGVVIISVADSCMYHEHLEWQKQKSEKHTKE